MSSNENRCDWAGNDSLYTKYHDEEWGVPTYDDQTLFEFLILETFQAGLSWITILKKRENFRKAFQGFDYNLISKYTDIEKERLVNDSGIIRNKLKINSAINNANAFMEIQKEFGTFSKYLWDFVDGKPIINQFQSMADVPATTALSDKISKDLKKRGFKFIGSTVMYAHMQACGMVNDHVVGCFCHPSQHN